jgi:hypothetical protein
MTQEEFIEVLKKEKYSYKIKGDKIVVAEEDRNVYLNDLTSLPPDAVFKNVGGVYLKSLTYLPPGVEFYNGGYVVLFSLTSLPPGMVFRNGGDVLFWAITSIPPGVEFKNGGDVEFRNGEVVDLKSLVDVSFHKWKGNIEGIESKRLLNLTIKQGMFI